MTWHPSTLTRIEEFYPDSGLQPDRNAAELEEFTRYFDSGELDASLAGVKVVFLGGFFSDYMPGYMSKAIRYLKNKGIEAEAGPIDSGASSEENARTLKDWLPSGQPYFLLCHSKGGMDFLTALKLFPEAGCFRALRGVAFSQTSFGPSAVMDELSGFLPPQSKGIWHRIKNLFMNAAIRLCGQARAAVELTTPWVQGARMRELESAVPCPLVAVACWSVKASSWTDSYHTRLCRHQPGVAHDGQFFLKDQLWNGKATQLILGGIDHAQPGMGGLGFDPGRYWQALLQMLAVRQRATSETLI